MWPFRKRTLLEETLVEEWKKVPRLERYELLHKHPDLYWAILRVVRKYETL